MGETSEVQADDGAAALSLAWLPAVERFQRGLNHALSNRAAAIAAVASVIEGDDVEMVARLRDEGSQLDRLLQLMRVLPRHRMSSPEPIRLGDLVSDVVAIWAEHPEYRDQPITIAGFDEAPPLRCHLQAMQHALLLGLTLTADAGAPVRVQAAWDDAGVTIGFGDAEPVATTVPGRALTVGARAVSALLAPDDALVWGTERRELWLRLPTLAALRARAKATA